MASPFVTIYITNYNYGCFIQQAIESVLHQSFTNFELYIIDDGSTDNSKEIIEAYSTLPNIHIIYQRNKGLNISNNIALRVAKGKYIMRLDADDFLTAEALREMVAVLEEDDTVGLVYPDYYLVDENNEKFGQVRRFNFEDEVTLPDLPAHGACTLIRKEMLIACGGYEEDFTCQDGYDLWIKFITKHKVRNINKPLFCYRRHGNNLTENEQKILTARAGIKNAFIKKNNVDVPDTTVIIPVRSAQQGGTLLPLTDVGEYTLLERSVRTALRCDYVKQIIITSSDDLIEEFSRKLQSLSSKIYFVRRPAKFSRFNETLSRTVQYIIRECKVQTPTVMTLAPEFPFIKTSAVEDALHTLAIFNCDSLISVRSDSRVYYRHTGQGLKPILGREKFTQFERESLYKAVGGINVCRLESFMQSKNMQCGKVGHIMIDLQQAHGIYNEFDLHVARLLADSEAVKENILKAC